MKIEILNYYTHTVVAISKTEKYSRYLDNNKNDFLNQKTPMSNSPAQNTSKTNLNTISFRNFQPSIFPRGSQQSAAST